MTLRLTKFQQRLCNELQEGLPVCSKPFDDLAKFLGSTEREVLQQIEELKKAGIIRRISALINFRALGKTATLVAAHIPQENLQPIANAINSIEGVSHNYLRNHHYNLWFTLQAETQEQIKTTLSNLSARFDINFYSLPVERIFKLDVRFDAEDNEQTLLKDVKQLPETKTVELKEHEKLLLSKLQQDLPITARPFDLLSSGGLEIEKVLVTIRQLVDKGVINRIAAVVNHHKLGFVANVLFVCKVPQDRIIEAGKSLARFRMVSHCYQRQTFENWPYNLFAMMHAKTMGEIQHVINKFTKAQKIDSFQLLPTTAELKKQPVTHHFY